MFACAFTELILLFIYILIAKNSVVIKLPVWKVGSRGFEPHSGIQVLKKQNVSSPLTRNGSIMQGNSAENAQGSNFESCV